MVEARKRTERKRSSKNKQKILLIIERGSYLNKLAEELKLNGYEPILWINLCATIPLSDFPQDIRAVVIDRIFPVNSMADMMTSIKNIFPSAKKIFVGYADKEKLVKEGKYPEYYVQKLDKEIPRLIGMLN